MDFNTDQRLTSLRKSSSCSTCMGTLLVQRRPPEGKRFEEGAIIFYQKDSQILPSHDNRYVTAYVRDMELTCSLIDPGSSRNIKLLSIFEAVGSLQTESSSSQQRCQVSEVVHHWLHQLRPHYQPMLLNFMLQMTEPPIINCQGDVGSTNTKLSFLSTINDLKPTEKIRRSTSMPLNAHSSR